MLTYPSAYFNGELLLSINHSLFLFLPQGTIKNGLRCDPSGSKAYYPLGSSVTVRHVAAGGGQEFLTGHTHPIGCLALSNSGKFLATGEKHMIGSKVLISQKINY